MHNFEKKVAEILQMCKIFRNFVGSLRVNVCSMQIF
jgi:hypothetical protein